MSDRADLVAPSDEELVAGTLDGDRAMFGALVERYWNTTVALALSRTGDPVQAEDIAQESFLRAYSYLHTLRNPSCFAGWLSTIVIRETVDQFRKQAGGKVVSIGDVPEPESRAPVPAPANPALTKKQTDIVRKAVARLPEKFRKVVVMRFITGLSSVEIAHQLGKRPGTVRVWLHRAYKILRKELAPVVEEARMP